MTDGKSPEERMTRVLRWYLSSFHAGRQSSVAKKPYNPILGETFRCHWKVDEDDGDGPYKDGILPWCSRSDLTFVAEQVIMANKDYRNIFFRVSCIAGISSSSHFGLLRGAREKAHVRERPHLHEVKLPRNVGKPLVSHSTFLIYTLNFFCTHCRLLFTTLAKASSP